MRNPIFSLRLIFLKHFQQYLMGDYGLDWGIVYEELILSYFYKENAHFPTAYLGYFLWAFCKWSFSIC